MNQNTIEISEFALSWANSNYAYSIDDVIDFACCHGWAGFGFVTSDQQQPVELPSVNICDPECQYLRAVSNAEAASNMLEKAAPGKWDNFHGILAYDYTDHAAHEAAERIGIALADEPVLDREDFDARESAAAASMLSDCYGVPVEIASDVAAALPEDGQSLCGHCTRWYLGSIRKRMGYQPCVECGEWIATVNNDPVHYECAQFVVECECIDILLDTHRHHDSVTTRTEVEAELRNCPHRQPEPRDRITTG